MSASVCDQVLQYTDSLGLNEQELPALRRQLVNWHSVVDDSEDSGLEDSSPGLASVLDDARTTFQLLRHLTIHNHRQFSRLHMHTLAFQVAGLCVEYANVMQCDSPVVSVQWLACSTWDLKVPGSSSLAACGCATDVGQLLFAPWAWAYSALHP